MSPDERIEALTHTVELLAQMHLDNERKHDERLRQTDERLRQTDERLNRIVGVVEKLAQIAESHERRIDALES
ncbi:MAG: hypothetical protein WB992_15890 [Bryobacteraceae bacterium]